MNFIPYKANEYLENSFYQVPKELFNNPYYMSLSLASKVLYGLLLDRLSLSTKAFKELKNVKLIREIRTGFKKNNIIYVGKINHVEIYDS